MRQPFAVRSMPGRLSGVALVLVLGLAACQPQAPDGGEAEAPADAPPAEALPTPAPAPAPPVAAGPYDGELRAVGTEPFWGLRISDTEITLERPDFPTSQGPNPGFVLEEGRAVWRTRTADGGDLMVTIWEAACSDGMSDLTYAYQARVQSGDETLSGCAGKEGAMPREGAAAP
ncbi:COG3650 family protein [Phenylobacterium sp.]|uniref:COG3650 family protein n=2 Tax=Phenylobacterium sp. TaxID=1871053 RepID=UPI004036EA38